MRTSKKIKYKYIQLKQLALATLIGLSLPATSQAIALLTEADGDFGELAMSKNDDGSSTSLTLPFDINFYGTSYTSFFVNNNGNISFNRAVSGFTPTPFPVAEQPMIAPFWADVDTRCVTCGEVYVGSANAETVIVTWNNVGFYSNNDSPTNNFQLVLRDMEATTGQTGDFDIEFRYDRLAWTTGEASGGDANGLGGTPAQAGFDAGDETNFFALPGSFTADVLNLQNTSNVSSADPGLWSFSIRQGSTPGETPDNPLQPVVLPDDPSFHFDFNVGDITEQIFIDPPVAIGYDYEIQSGTNTITSVQLPDFGDGMYDLWLWDGAQFVDSLTDIAAGDQYFFAPGGVTRFSIRGIEASEMLDPANPLAFVTALTFSETGPVSMTQTPVVIDVPTNGVPEPASFALFGIGAFGLVAARRRIKK